MNEKKKRNWLTIAGLIALIIVLCAGVELLFTGLGMVIPKSAPRPEPAGPALRRDGGPRLLSLLRGEAALLLPVGPVLPLVRGAGRPVN